MPLQNFLYRKAVNFKIAPIVTFFPICLSSLPKIIYSPLHDSTLVMAHIHLRLLCTSALHINDHASMLGEQPRCVVQGCHFQRSPKSGLLCVQTGLS